MSRVVLGRHWRGLGSGKREAFTELFGDLMVAAFAYEIGPFEGQTFKFAASKPLRRGRVLVRSRLESKAGKPDQFDFVLHRAGGGWKIVNLIVNGVSDLALKRSEYGTLVERGGIEGLERRIRRQIEDYRAPQ